MVRKNKCDKCRKAGCMKCVCYEGKAEDCPNYARWISILCLILAFITAMIYSPNPFDNYKQASLAFVFLILVFISYAAGSYINRLPRRIRKFARKIKINRLCRKLALKERSPDGNETKA